MKRILSLFILVIATQIVSNTLIDSYTQEAKRDYAKALETMEELSKEQVGLHL